MGIGDNTFRSSQFGEGSGEERERFDYGGKPGVVTGREQEHMGGSWAARTRGGPQVNTNLSDQTRAEQGNALALARARAEGRTPSIAQTSGERTMGQLAAQQQSQAASARGAGALAMAQGNAAANTAAGQGQIAGATADAAARERLAAEQMYGQQSGQMRGMDAQQGQFQANLDLQSRTANDQKDLAHQQMLQDVYRDQTQANIEQQRLKAQSHQQADAINAQVNQKNADNEWGGLEKVASAAGGLISGVGAFLSDERAKAPITPMLSSMDGKIGLNGMDISEPPEAAAGAVGMGGDSPGAQFFKGNPAQKGGPSYGPKPGGMGGAKMMLSDFVGKEAPTYQFDPSRGWFRPEPPGEAALNTAMGEQVARDRSDAQWEQMAADAMAAPRSKSTAIAPGDAPKGYAQTRGRDGVESVDPYTADNMLKHRGPKPQVEGLNLDKYFNDSPADDSKAAPGTADYIHAMGGSERLDGKGEDKKPKRSSIGGEEKEKKKVGVAEGILGGLGKGLTNVSDARAKGSVMLSDSKAKAKAYEEGQAAMLRQVREAGGLDDDALRKQSETSPAAALVRAHKRAAYDRGGRMHAVSPETMKAVETEAHQAGAAEAAEQQRLVEAEFRAAQEAKRQEQRQRMGAMAKEAAIQAVAPGLTTVEGAGKLATGAATGLRHAVAGSLSDARAKGPMLSSMDAKSSEDDYLAYINRTDKKMAKPSKAPTSREQLAKADSMLAEMKANLARGPSVTDRDRPAPWLDKYMDDERMAETNRALRGAPYTYRKGLTPDEQSPGEVNVGPMAQNLAKDPVARTAVKKDPKTGMLALDRDKVLKLNSSGIAALQRQIDEMKASMEASLKQPPAVHKSLKRSGG